MHEKIIYLWSCLKFPRNKLEKLPLHFNGSHGFIGKITFTVNLNSFADELQTSVQILLPLELK